jgi:hypothetical protein
MVRFPIVLIVAALMFVPSLASLAKSSWNDTSPPNTATKQVILDAFDSLNNYFVENRGQVAENIRYYAMGNPAVAFMDDGVMFVLHDANDYERNGMGTRNSTSDFRTSIGSNEEPVDSVTYLLRFDGANMIAPSGERHLPFNSNFFLGNDTSKWRTDVPNYGELIYKNLYDGIDLIYKPILGGVKYEFRISAGANPASINMAYEGIESMRIETSGIAIRTTMGDVRDSSPYSYQDIGEEIDCEFLPRSETSYGFDCNGWNPSKPLTIDPLIYATYLGGWNADAPYAIDVDGAGNAYVTGHTISFDFPVTPGAFDTWWGNGGIFVTKINASGDTLAYSTYIGGSYQEFAYALSVDTSGNAYVTGEAQSPDFPVTPGAYDTTYHGSDAFVLKLNASGSGLIFSTFVGGSSNDIGYALYLDSSGNTYVCGTTLSPDFPTTPGAFSSTSKGREEVFVFKLSDAGDALLSSTYLGGSMRDEGNSIFVNERGEMVVGGFTLSADFPVTPGSFDTTFNYSDVFVAKLNNAGTSLIYSTFIGGTDWEDGGYVIEDSADALYVTGLTDSSDFPVTADALDASLNGTSDMFLSRLDINTSTLSYSTFLGGNSSESPSDLVMDALGNLYLTGRTFSPDFPTTPDAIDRTLNSSDAFVIQLGESGRLLSYSTLIGGSAYEVGLAASVDSAGAVYITGKTDSTDFPVTPSAFDTSYNLNTDGFVAKLGPIELPDLLISPNDLHTVPQSPIANGTSIILYVNVSNVGDSNVTDFSVTSFDDYDFDGQVDPSEIIEIKSAGSLPVYQQIELQFSWTPDFVGNHSVCAWADPPPGSVAESNETNNVACITAEVVSSFAMSLSPGKRFMSFPLSAVDVTIENVLSSISGCYDYVRWYDSLDPMNPWKSYVPGRDANGLHALTNTMGFWIDVTSACNFTIRGTESSSTAIDLRQGWNMVGFPSLNTTCTVADLKADIGLTGVIIEAFDSSAAPYYLQRVKDSYLMKPGEGYWIFVPADATWIVNG